MALVYTHLDKWLLRSTIRRARSIRTSHITSLCAHGIGLRSPHSRAHGISSLRYDYRAHGISPRSRYSHTHAVPILTPRQKFKFLYWIYWIYIFIGFPLYGTLFPTVGFSHRVYRRGFNEAIGTLCFPFFHPLWRFFMSFGLACMLAATECSKRGSVAISHSFSFVTCRITSYTCIQTFHFSCLSL